MSRSPILILSLIGIGCICVKAGIVDVCKSKRCRPETHPDINGGKPVTRCQPGGWNNGCIFYSGVKPNSIKCCGPENHHCKGAGTFMGDRFWDIDGDGKINHDWKTSVDCGRCCGDIVKKLPGFTLENCKFNCVAVGNPWNGNHGGINGCKHACEWMEAHSTKPPSKAPTASPSPIPSSAPSMQPSSLPSSTPSSIPTVGPTVSPPTATPTSLPTQHICQTVNHFCDTANGLGICYEVEGGSASEFTCGCIDTHVCLPNCKSPQHMCVPTPTRAPTLMPTTSPSRTPTTTAPTTTTPTSAPTSSPTVTPTTAPTITPTLLPTSTPTHYYEIFVNSSVNPVECIKHTDCNKSAYCAFDGTVAKAFPFCRTCVEGEGNAAIGCADYEDPIDGTCPSNGARIQTCNPDGVVSSSTNPNASTASEATTTIIVVVVVGVLLVIAVVTVTAVIIRPRSGKTNDSEERQFHNPMYDEAPNTKTIELDSQTSGYSDVVATGNGVINPNAGYMDVAPTGIKGYMDVAPADGQNYGFDDDDEEDV